MRPKTILLPVWPRNTRRLDTSEHKEHWLNLKLNVMAMASQAGFENEPFPRRLVTHGSRSGHWGRVMLSLLLQTPRTVNELPWFTGRVHENLDFLLRRVFFSSLTYVVFLKERGKKPLSLLMTLGQCNHVIETKQDLLKSGCRLGYLSS